MYIVLASKSWACSNTITSAKAPAIAEMEKAKACVKEGLGYVDQALTLEPEDENAWSYKANLFKEVSTIAGLQKQQSEQVSFQSQYTEALNRSKEFAARSQTEREKNVGKMADSSSTPEREVDDKDLIEFTAEHSVEKVMADLFPPSLDLASLVASGTVQKDEPSAPTFSPRPLAQQKHDWKPFTIADDLTLDLPDDVKGADNDYAAGSEGVIYEVMSAPS